MIGSILVDAMTVSGCFPGETNGLKPFLQVPRARRHQQVDLIALNSLEEASPESMVMFQMPNQQFNRCSTTMAAFLISLRTRVSFQRHPQKNDVGLTHLFLSPITAITNAALDRLLANRHRLVQGLIEELWSSLVFRNMNQAAAWLISVTSIPSLNLMPITSFAR